MRSGDIERILAEIEVAMKPTQRWNYWKPLIAAAKREHQRDETAFNDQSTELETAVLVLEEIHPDCAMEYRYRQYPTLHKRPDGFTMPKV